MSKKPKTGGTKNVPVPVAEPDDMERTAIQQASQRNKNRVPPVSVKIAGNSDDGAIQFDCPHADKHGWVDRLSDTFGTWSGEMLNVSLAQLTNLSKSAGQPLTQDQVNAALAFIHAVKPEDEMEAALAVQMFGTHSLATFMLMRAKSADSMDHLREYTNLATKLQRTFTGQIEALTKLRRGGEQVVRHVHVYEGGQAVVADEFHHHGVSRNEKSFAQPYGPGYAPPGSPPLLGQDPARNGVPVPGDEGEEPVSHSRRQKPRRAKGQPA